MRRSHIATNSLMFHHLLDLDLTLDIGPYLHWHSLFFGSEAWLAQGSR